MQWYLLAFRRFTDINGRSTRREYWWFALINVLIIAALTWLEGVLGLSKSGQQYGIFSGMYAFGVLMPGIAVGIRRLHDRNSSGWWLLLALIPGIGTLVLLILMIRPSTQGPNRFGSESRGLATSPA